MTTLTKDQHTALLDALDALEEKAVAAHARDDLESGEYLDEQWNVLRVLVNTATIEASDTTPLWRDRPREDWMLDGEIHLELVADPCVTVEINPAWIARGTSVMVEGYDSETVAVSPEHLPALIAMLQEMQRRIGGEAK